MPDVLGAYGLRIHGLESASAALQAVPEGSPALTVTWRCNPPGSDVGRPSEITAEGVDLRLVGDGRMVMRRGEQRVEFSLAHAPTAEELVHPYLAPGAALAQLWHGNEALHGGAFATAAGAILLLGGKEDGKSTTLAWIARHHRLAVMADDLAVIAGDSVLAGPRCIDMRTTSAIDPEALGGEQAVRGDERRRVALPPAPGALPLVAIVSLRWGERPALDRRPVAERLPALIEQRMYRHSSLPADPVALLDLAGLPMMTLTRPRGERGLRDGIDLLLGRLS